MRGGKDYNAKWGERMTGNGPYAAQISKRFAIALKRCCLNRKRLDLRTDLFTPPVAAGMQIPLF
ncbi:hypothetical protein MnTg02_02913 [bacterium MnTg02]|nr:hypothetical protein MnTg02_02913 [bacterium MnTg02]